MTGIADGIASTAAEIAKETMIGIGEICDLRSSIGRSRARSIILGSASAESDPLKSRLFMSIYIKVAEIHALMDTQADAEIDKLYQEKDNEENAS